MSNSAHADNASSVAYVKKFMNTVASFKHNDIQVPDYEKRSGAGKKGTHAIVPFTFGKESLLTVALGKEIGIHPHLVYVVEPTHAYEYKHKKSLMGAFFRETGLKVHEIKHGPGRMRYGRLWSKNTELGWGLQTTEYVLLSLPFLHYWNAEYITLGNERSCAEAAMDSEGILTHWTAYDQHPDWTPQQGLLASLMVGRKTRVISLVEPLHEIAEIAVLHRRYPEFAQFQTSCLAIDKKARSNRWCQNCEKCASMYAFLQAVGADVARLGFTENLFDGAHAHLYKNLFRGGKNKDSAHYAVEEELFLALHIANKRGLKGNVIDTFKRRTLPKFRKAIGEHMREYFGIHASNNMPAPLRKRAVAIYEEELSKVRKEISKIL